MFKAIRKWGLGSSPYDQEILRLCIPTMLALAVDPLMAIVDTAFVGHLGAEQLGALGVNTSLFTFTFVVFNFLSTATTPLIATSQAEGNKRRSGILCAQGLIAASALGITVIIALLLNSDLCLYWMGISPEQDEAIFSYAKQFLLTRAWAAPAVLLITVSQGIFRGAKDTRTPLAVTIGANSINLLLDFVLILGMGMDLRGAGIATNTAEWIAAVVFMSALYLRRKEFGIDKESFRGVNVAEYLPFLTAGGAVLLRTVFLLGTKTLATATIARMGAAQVASHQVLYQIWMISVLVIDSLAVAGQTLVAIELGRGSTYQAKQVSNRLMQLSIVLGLGLTLGFAVLGADRVCALFTEDRSVIGFVEKVFPIAVGMLPVNAVAYILDGVLLGASDFGYLASAMAGVTIFSVIVMQVAESMGWGLEGVWWSLSLLMFGRVGSLGWRYNSEHGPFGGSDDEAMQKMQSNRRLSNEGHNYNGDLPFVSLEVQEMQNGKLNGYIDDYDHDESEFGRSEDNVMQDIVENSQVKKLSPKSR